MPYEFKDLSKQVSKGAKLVDKELQKMLVDTTKVDKAQKKLTKTQKSALQISDKYRKSLKSLNREFITLKKTSLAASKSLSVFSGRKTMQHMTGLAVTVEDLADNLKDLSKTKVAIRVDSGGIEDVKASVDRATKASLKLAATSKHFDVFGKSTTRAGHATTRLSRNVDDLGGELERVRGLMSLVVDKFREGKRDVSSFGDGVGLSQTRMVAAGAAAFYLLQKAGDLVGSFKDARMGLASFNVDLAKMGKVTLGVDASQLKKYKDELSLTREQASRFFDVLREGSASGVISVQDMVNAAGNLQKAFGGDPTQRLQDYVDLLKEIPTLDADLKVTASLDDQAASLFDLARKGKISTVIELQQAGLLGGIDITTASPNDIKLLNSNQKTEKYTEDIRDYLLNKLFPSFGPQLSAISEHTFKALGLMGGAAAIAGAFNAFFVRKQNQLIRATENVERSIWATAGKGMPASHGPVGRVAGGFTIKDFRTMKGAFSRGFSRGGGGLGGVGRGVRGAAMSTAVTRSMVLTAKKITGMSKAVDLATKGFSRVGTVLKVVAGPLLLVGLALDAAGAAADWLSGKFEDAGDKGYAALAKMSGSAFSAAGSILTMASAGAVLGTLIAGPLGTAVGTAAGALAGLAVAAYNNMESLGTAVQSFGGELSGVITVAGKPADKYIGIVDRFGQALEAAGSLTKEWGKEIGVTTRNYVKAYPRAVKAVAYWAYSLFTTTGRTQEYLKKFGKSVGWAAGEIQKTGMSLKYKEYLEKSATLMGLANDATKGMAETSKEFDKLWKEALDRTMQSTLSLERQFNATAAVAKTGKVALFDFQKEVAGLDIEMLSQAGGSASQFSEAVSASSDAVRDKFKELVKGYGEQRKEIAADATKSAADRKAALLDLHQKELEATKEFVNGMSMLMEALLKTPQAIAAGLKTEISRTRIETTAGVLPLEELGKELDRGISNITDELKEAFAAGPKVEAEIKKREEAKAKAEEEFRKVTPAQLKGKRGEAKKVFEGVFDIAKTVDGEVVKGVMDAKLAQKKLEELNAERSKLESAYNDKKLRNRAMAGEASRAAKESVKISASLLARKAEEDATKTGNGLKEAAEEVAARDEVVRELKEGQVKAERELAGVYERLGLTTKESREAFKAALASEDAAAIKKYASAGNAAYDEAAFAFAQQLGDMKDSVKAMAERERLEEQVNEKQKDISTLQTALTATTDLTNQNMEERLKVQKHQADMMRKHEEILRTIAESESSETWETKHRLEVLKAESSRAKLSGRALENLADISKTELELYDKQWSQNDVKRKKHLKEIANMRASMAAPDISEDVREKYGKMIGDTEKAIVGLSEEIDVATDRVSDAFYGIGRAIDEAADSFQGKEAQFKLDLSAARMELAEFSSDADAMVAKAVAEGKRGLAERLDQEKKSIEEKAGVATTAVSKMPNIEKARLRDLLANKKITQEEHDLRLREFDEAWPRLRAEKERSVETQKQLELTKAETKYKKDAMKLADDSLAIKRSEIDISDKLLAAQMEYAQASGASASVVLGIQKQQVDNARKEWEYAIAKLEAAKQDTKLSKDSTKLKELSMEVEVARLRMNQKSIGVQRDMMEKVIGSAIGAARTSFGARKERLTDIGLMGMEATRAKTTSGMYQKAGPGGVKSYQDRMNDIRLGVGDMRDQGAERLQIEKDMANNLRGTKEGTKETAAATTSMDSRSKTTGSLYTHDTVSEGLLSSILASAKTISDGIWTIVDEMTPAGGKGGAAGDVKTGGKVGTVTNEAFAGGLSPRQSRDEQWFASQGITNKLTAAATAAENRGAINAGAGAAPYEPTNPPAGVAGGGTAKVEGKITVHFDNNAFRDEIADVVGRIIQSPEIQKSLQKSGTINKNQ